MVITETLTCFSGSFYSQSSFLSGPCESHPSLQRQLWPASDYSPSPHPTPYLPCHTPPQQWSYCFSFIAKRCLGGLPIVSHNCDATVRTTFSTVPVLTFGAGHVSGRVRSPAHRHPHLHALAATSSSPHLSVKTNTSDAKRSQMFPGRRCKIVKLRATHWYKGHSINTYWINECVE